MTKSFEVLRGMSDSDAKLLHDIQRVGWHVIKVFEREAKERPNWSFSIGLFHSFGHPEVVLFGLPLDRCMTLVNVIGREVQAGQRYQHGEEYTDILQDPYKCAFRQVPRWAGLGGILFIIGWSLTRNHNLKFYLTIVVGIAAFYLCARAGYGWIGAIAVVVLFNLSKVLHMYDNAKPDELTESKAEEQQTELPFHHENNANGS